MSCSVVPPFINQSKILYPPLAFSPISQPGFRNSSTLFRSKKIRGCLTIRASSAPSDTDTIVILERCFAMSAKYTVPDTLPSSTCASSSHAPSTFCPTMKMQYGAHGAVTLERPKVEWSQKQSKSSPEVSTGGGGGDIGKRISHGGGGGDGGDGGGDDDDYTDFDDDDHEGNEGWLFRRRIILQEVFDRGFVDAVLSEWQKTMRDLPAGIRQAYEMGLLSSAQMVRFLAVHARPTAARFISRALPQGVSRAFVGRMIADPAFLYRLVVEEACTICFCGWSEWNTRKHRMRKEWAQASANVLAASACTAVIVWSLAPCRSYGNTFKFDLQNTLQKLPNNVFEKSYPLREFDLQKRLHCFLYKSAQLCVLGSVRGILSCSTASGDGMMRRRPPVAAALRNGALLGVYGNLRYQLLCGADRLIVDRFDVIGVALALSTVFRIMNNACSVFHHHSLTFNSDNSPVSLLNTVFQPKPEAAILRRRGSLHPNIV